MKMCENKVECSFNKVVFSHLSFLNSILSCIFAPLPTSYNITCNSGNHWHCSGQIACKAGEFSEIFLEVLFYIYVSRECSEVSDFKIFCGVIMLIGLQLF